ncbi:MAG: hypothetical protein OHK0048_13940 [Rhodoferax sp.]
MNDVERAFSRDMGCTAAEFSGWLRAVLDHPHAHQHDGAAHTPVGSGVLRLSWAQQPDRHIASIRLPVLRVTFAFEGVSPADQAAFMARFDLYMQRGGG